MCGIIGAAGQTEGVDLAPLVKLLSHRGPDETGLVSADRVQLGHARLSIIDVAGGQQPMWDRSRTRCVVFNGEIYNYLELKKELAAAGYEFQTNSDTEVILNGYAHWGRDFPRRLSGMFAFVIYDRSRRELFCCRDRHAKKPLYYFNDGKRFAFSSELKPLLLLPFVGDSVSTKGLSKYLAYGMVPAPHTIVEGVRKLVGGEAMIVSTDTFTSETFSYWQLDFSQRIRDEDRTPAGGIDEDAVKRHIVELLQAATERRLMSEVPLGIFLSGGIDSSAVAAMACRLLPAKQIETFAVAFDDPSFDESGYARQVAQFLGTRHHEQMICEQDLRTLVPEVIEHLDEPIADGSVVPTALLASFTRRYVTVALGGDGGDELFAGYDTFRAHLPALRAAQWLPRRSIPILRHLAGWLPVSHRNFSLDFRARLFLRALEYPTEIWHPVWFGLVEPRAMSEYLPGTAFAPEELYDEVYALLRDTRFSHPWDSLLAIYSRFYMQMVLTKVDRMSMKSSLEVRAPFLDNDFVDYVTGLPFPLKFAHNRSKVILKKALEGVLPHNIIYRPKKGFGMPIGRWLQNELQDYARSLLTRDALTDLGLNAGKVAQLLDQHVRGIENHRVVLWGLIALVGWRQAIRSLRAAPLERGPSLEAAAGA